MGCVYQLTLEKLEIFQSMEVLFPEYFQSISRIFSYYEIGQNYGNWILQPFFTMISKMFPAYYGRGPGNATVKPSLYLFIVGTCLSFAMFYLSVEQHKVHVSSGL